MATDAPSSAAALAVAKPIPVLPPKITTRLFTKAFCLNEVLILIVCIFVQNSALNESQHLPNDKYADSSSDADDLCVMDHFWFAGFLMGSKRVTNQAKR
jgi:hypothetical protein